MFSVAQTFPPMELLTNGFLGSNPSLNLGFNSDFSLQ